MKEMMATHSTGTSNVMTNSVCFVVGSRTQPNTNESIRAPHERARATSRTIPIPILRSRGIDQQTAPPSVPLVTSCVDIFTQIKTRPVFVCASAQSSSSTSCARSSTSACWLTYFLPVLWKVKGSLFDVRFERRGSKWFPAAKTPWEVSVPYGLCSLRRIVDVLFGMLRI